VADRKPVLANRAALDAFKLAASKLQHWHVLAAVLMPDHLHVLVAPTKERYEFNEIEHEHEHDYEKDRQANACPTIS
jgi:REP element-mobilizing transposase RayT